MLLNIIYTEKLFFFLLNLSSSQVEIDATNLSIDQLIKISISNQEIVSSSLQPLLIVHNKILEVKYYYVICSLKYEKKIIQTQLNNVITINQVNYNVIFTKLIYYIA